MKTTLILIRHGETNTNIGRKLHARGDLETLNKKGIEQTKKTAKVLKKMKISCLYSSKEKRAKDSAKIISKICGLEPKLIDRIEERNWGDFTGKPWGEVKEILDPMTLNERYNFIPPNGESWKQTEERLIKSVNKILKQENGEIIAVVTHGGAIRILMPHFLGAPIEETFKHDPDNASLTVFDYDNDKFTKKKLNDTTHLKKQ